MEHQRSMQYGENERSGFGTACRWFFGAILGLLISVILVPIFMIAALVKSFRHASETCRLDTENGLTGTNIVGTVLLGTLSAPFYIAASPIKAIPKAMQLGFSATGAIDGNDNCICCCSESSDAEVREHLNDHRDCDLATPSPSVTDPAVVSFTNHPGTSTDKPFISGERLDAARTFAATMSGDI